MKHILSATTLLLLLSQPASATFDGPRVYWPLPKNTNIVSGHYLFGTANASWTNWSRIQPELNISSDLYMLTYTRVQPVFGRTAYFQLSLPAATLDTSSPLSIAGDTFTNGFGDPVLGATFNLYGTPGLKAKEFLRHDLDLSVHLGVQVTFPFGQYDGEESLNVGSIQWKVRLSAPIVKSLGPWVPGKRLTLEVMPAVVLFGDNDDAQGGEIEQDPLWSVEVHLTRDMTQQAFVSLDYTWIDGGEETLLDGDTGSVLRESQGLETQMLGATLGFEVNDHLRLFLTHMQTFSEEEDGLSLEGSLTKVTLSWSWHDVLEKVRQFRRN
jgi:hypothetical protein